MTRTTAMLLVLLCLTACSGDPLAPFEPEVTNVANNFQLQATGVTNTTATLTYDWQNTGNQASVDHSTVIALGQAQLRILDADGTQVYNSDLLPSGNETTLAGTAGTWQIEVIIDDYSGTLNFRVQTI